VKDEKVNRNNHERRKQQRQGAIECEENQKNNDLRLIFSFKALSATAGAFPVTYHTNPPLP
jgi:hypothetical protein